ncbi:MAG: hypothetical protein FJY82_09815 [Candidatus Aminicenantes bacterium]|nr:hypothetical protein [Candidatus Aminicenantes bacterium]
MTKTAFPRAVKALLFAAGFTALFWPATFRAYERVSVTVQKGPAALAETPLRFAFEAAAPAGGPWVLALKLSGGNPSRRALDVSLGGTAVGTVDLRPGEIEREFALLVPAGALRSGRNELALGPGPPSLRVERITVKNFLGFSRGWLSFIVLPRTAEVGRGLPVPGAAALFLALGILFLLRPGSGRLKAARAYLAAASVFTGLVFGGALLYPLVGGPKLLFEGRSLWLFVVLLHAPVVLRGAAAAFGNLRVRLRTDRLAAAPLRGSTVCLALAVLALAFNAGFVKSVLRFHEGDYSGFLHIYPETLEKFVRLHFPGMADPLSGRLKTTIEEYDGQYFYFMAHDPFLSRFRRDPEKYRWFIDEPAYRCHRIGYPWLVRLLSLGRPETYPAVMTWLIAAAGAAGVFLLGRILLLLGRSPFWALLYPLVPGFHLSLYFSLPEPLAAAFLLGGSLFYLRRRTVPAAVCLGFSLLIRETGILLVAALAAFELVRKKDVGRSLILASAVLPLALWRGFVTLRLFPVYGWKTLWFGPGDITAPFVGIGRLVAEVVQGSYLYADLAVPTLAYAFLLVLIAAAAPWLAGRTGPWGLGLLLFSLLSLSLNLEKIWVHVDNAARGTHEAFVLVLLASAAVPAGRKAAVRIGLAAFFALVLAYDLFLARLSPHVQDALRLSF